MIENMADCGTYKVENKSFTGKITTYDIDESQRAEVKEHGKYNEKVTVRIYKTGFFKAIASKTFYGCDRETLAVKFINKF